MLIIFPFKLEEYFIWIQCFENSDSFLASSNPLGIYMFKVNKRNTRTRSEICSKLTIKTPEWRQWPAEKCFILMKGEWYTSKKLTKNNSLILISIRQIEFRLVCRFPTFGKIPVPSLLDIRTTYIACSI